MCFKIDYENYFRYFVSVAFCYQENLITKEEVKKNKKSFECPMLKKIKNKLRTIEPHFPLKIKNN